MARNGSGTYSTLNTFVTLTPISSSDHNENWADIATEMSNSIAADGQTPITGALKGANGTVSLPAYAFASDLDCGMYRIGANNIGVAANGAKVLDIGTAGLGVTGTLVVSGAATFTTPLATAAIADDAVTFAKLLNATAGSKLIGSTAAGNFQEIGLGTGISLSGSDLVASVVLPRGYIDGLILSNGTDATNDINIAAGTCRDSTNTINITIGTALGKQLDANWAAGGTTGTPAGMRNSAAGIANGTYHLYAAAPASGVGDVYAVAGVAGTDPDSTASIAAVITAIQLESGGATYAYARRIGSILRESATIVPFLQAGDLFQRKSWKDDVALTDPTTSVLNHTLSIPTGLNLIADIGLHLVNGSGTVIYGHVYDPTLATNETAAEAHANFAADASRRSAGQYNVGSSTSAIIRTRQSFSSASVVLNIATRGWRDTRGKDA